MAKAVTGTARKTAHPKITGRYKSIRSEEGYEIADIQFGYSYLKLNNLIRSNIRLEKYLCLSTVEYPMDSPSVKQIIKNGNKILFITTIEEEIALADRRKHEQGFIAGIGARYGRYTLEARYEDCNGMAMHTHMKPQTKRYFVLIGYRF